MSDQTTSVYTALESDCIRLVRIFPQSPDDPTADLRCTMRHFELDDLPAYSALSYAWGTEPSSRSILLNDQRFDVRKNLFDFLSLARNLSGPYAGWLFIDAISINQRDHAERSSQVSQMWRIYSSAIPVLAWLGPRHDNSDLAMQELGRNPSYWQDERNMSAIWIGASGRAIRALCSRPYWSRLWVFVELSLASKVQLVYGTAAVSWDAFRDFILATQGAVITPAVFDYVEGQLWKNPAIGEHQAMCALPAIQMIQYASMRAGSTDLWELMFALSHLDCGEPRDEVYALLGVAAPRGPELVIQSDYHTSLPNLLNTVLKHQHHLQPPESIEQVQSQCTKLESLFGE
ncbi:hypothetical protein LTR97_005785 [Elasticomyces elasticus]|uniref:Heterokaryon incompatibility domain-containing protein n=1 Tax=Elasticomyces elasticus TaxID=574655 RepID=A0AAN7W5M2_9PEZI|nr:hypothetical protein LTR97_005785 [Elasticomyces elasticus]KAK5721686.1 hypothetical protein LTR15_006277 [Elasticomyces elasticus]